ncbi:hypothetical protein BVRB_4g088620 [Beta vulgaris subsp. vulgaris]|uniref:uncharacterized protein LOC104891704 isoform X1 n=1 Tax=Beta vulgaris subsp. vulgaris TaxID=3555 RepID=UPI00053F6D85|nr:uncharacterized protein LOC104891704 isoform X1 [Beta vulgaris subsp. vulgaris]KMT12768.1 hypothetical protein BVRB_4g088620 [Beta vulgaris subsp. vulgaris]
MTGRTLDDVLLANSASSSDQLLMFPPNFPLVSSLLAISLAQFLKIFTSWFKEKRWDSKRMLSSGGMPSSHSAGVTALAMAIGLQEGTGGSAFALAVVLACVVMYDASGVRLHAGQQAQLLNQIVCELPPEHPVSNCKPLRDSLGHTPLQVLAGAILGLVVAYLVKFYR